MKTIQEIRDRAENVRERYMLDTHPCKTGDCSHIAQHDCDEVLQEWCNENPITYDLVNQLNTDITALIKCVEIMKHELECSTNWYLAKCECCRPFGDRAKKALDEVGAILGSSHIANRDSQYEPKHQPYTSAFDLEQLTIKDVAVKLDPKSTFKNEDGYLTGTIEDPENEGKIK